MRRSFVSGYDEKILEERRCPSAMSGWTDTS